MWPLYVAKSKKVILNSIIHTHFWLFTLIFDRFIQKSKKWAFFGKQCIFWYIGNGGMHSWPLGFLLTESRAVAITFDQHARRHAQHSVLIKLKLHEMVCSLSIGDVVGDLDYLCKSFWVIFLYSYSVFDKNATDSVCSRGISELAALFVILYNILFITLLITILS